MLLLDQTLLKLAKGLWKWIIAIVAVRFLALIGIARFASAVGMYLGSFLSPGSSAVTLTDAVRSALLASVLTLGAQLLQGELEYRCTAQARHQMRASIFNKVLELDAGNIERIGPVSAITSSVEAVERMQTYYSTYLPSLIFSLIAPVYLFFRLRNTSGTIAVLLLCISLILLPINNVFRARIEALRRTYWNSVEDMTAYYLDSIRGLTTLKLFNRTEDHRDTLARKAEQLNVDINKFMKVNFTSFLVTETMMYSSIAGSLILLCVSVKKNPTYIGSALTVLMLSYSYFSSLRSLMSATHTALTAVSAATKVEDIMAVDTSRPYDPDLPEDPSGKEGITFRNVSFGYEGRDMALKDISLHIQKGSTAALVGLSGSGKSTIASLMMRFFDPQSGDIYIDGRNLKSMKPEELRKKIIMVPQSVSLFSGTIRDNLLIAAGAQDNELMEALEEVQLTGWVRSLPEGLDTDVGDAGSRLSGGQRQKIGIARALLSKAEYIIFDEATSSVDTDSEREIRACIERLGKTRSLIIISHRMSSIRNAHEIYVLEHGQIAEHGSHESLLQSDGLYRKLVNEQEALEAEL